MPYSVRCSFCSEGATVSLCLVLAKDSVCPQCQIDFNIVSCPFCGEAMDLGESLEKNRCDFGQHFACPECGTVFHPSEISWPMYQDGRLIYRYKK